MPDRAGSPVGAAAGLFAVPVGGRWLLHSPSAGSSALVNSAAVRKLARGAAPEDFGLDILAAVPSAKPLDGVDRDYRPAFLGLIPTRDCNLRCRYCGFRAGAGSERQMSPETAVAAIEWSAADCLRRSEEVLNVHLFGGEPLVARDLVDVIVHRTRAVAARDGLIPHLETATNGVYPDETARFVADYFDVVALSLDGPPELHNRHRCRPGGSSSYEAVAATGKVLSESVCDLILRACVSNENVGSMAEIVRWFCDQFAPSSIDFEPLQPTAETLAAGLAPPAAIRFAEGFLEARDEGARRGIEVSFSGSMLGHSSGSCPAQNDGLIVSPDGRISSCYLLEADWRSRGLDLNIGWVSTEGLVRIELEATRRVRELADPQSKCLRCFCQASCRGGCRVNHLCSPVGEAYDDFCIETRLITAALLLQQLDAAGLGRELLTGIEFRQAFLGHLSDRLCDWSGTI